MLNKDISKRTINEICTTVKSGLSSYYLKGKIEDAKSVQVINVKDIQDGFIDSSTVEQVPVRETDLLEKSKIKKGDLILSTKGVNLKAAVADESIDGFAISANLTALTLSDEVKPEIVAAYLNSPIGQKELHKRAGGATLKRLNTKSLMELPVPIISLEKQEELHQQIQLTYEYNRSMLEEGDKRKLIIGTVLVLLNIFARLFVP